MYWVETKGKTLEEVDALFEGEKHSQVPDVETVRKGEASVDVSQLEHELQAEIEDAGGDEPKQLSVDLNGAKKYA